MKRPPRRRKPTAAARLRPFWIPIAIAGVLVVAGITFAIVWSGFEPKFVDVTGNRVVPRAEIVDHAAIAPHLNMWLQNTGAMAGRITTIPYVATAGVYRVPPATLLISVKERIPFAIIASGVRMVLVDRDLRVLQDASNAAEFPEFVLEPGLPLVPGTFVRNPSALALRDDYDAMIAAHVVPVQLELDSFGGLVATMRGGVRILLGDGADLPKKLALVDPILAQVVRKTRRVDAVDLRAPSTPVIVYK